MAGRSLGSLTVDLILKTGGFAAGMDQSARAAEKSLKRIQSTARGIGTAVAAGFAVLGGANLFGAMIRNTIEAEDALAQLDARLKSTGGVAGVTSEQIVEFAKSMQSVTTFGDDAIISMNALLLTFTNIRGERVFGATEAILDFAAALKTDLPSAAQTVGRALNDPVRGIALLRRSGIEFTKDQENLVKALVKTGDVAAAQGIILDKLSTKYGGSAAAAADTFGGALKQLQNAFGDLLEADGEGINGATDAIQGLTKVLQDPATIAAAQALTGGIASAFQFLAEDIAKGVNAIRSLGEDIAAARFGPAADDVERLTERLRQATETRDSFLDPVARTELFGPNGIIEFWNDAELDAEIARLQGLIAAATKNTAAAGFGGMAAGLFKAGQPAASSAPGSAPIVLPPSEEFEKISAKLREQVALYGKTGEAAKLAYQIQIGAIEGLTEEEGKRLISLARQYDSLVASAAASKELEQAQQQLQKAYDDQVSTYEKQIALTEDVTELEKLRFEISSGGLEGITEAQQQYLEGLAREVDLNKELAESQKVKEENQKLFESQTDEYQRQIDRVSELSELEKLRYEFANGELAKLTEAQKKVLEGLAEQTDAVRAAQEEEKKLADARERALENLQRNFQDILADGLTNGFDDGIKGVLDSFADMLTKMAAQAIAADIASRIFGDDKGGSSGGGGGGGGWLSNIFSFFSSRDQGGRGQAGVPVMIGSGAQPELFVPDSAGEFYPRGSYGGGGGAVTQNIYTSSPITQRSARQIELEAAKRQRIATARLG